MFLFSTFIIVIGLLYHIIHAAELPCTCSSGCITTNRCLTDDPDCKIENVALNKTAAMSNVYINSEQTEESGPACLAVNGNRNHTIVFIKKQQPSTVGINCIHTSELSSDPWWSVDLGAKFTITYVTIYNRDSNQEGLNNVKVSVDQQLCDTITGIKTDLIINVTCDNPVRGQNIRLHKQGKFFLNFCEVEVWVCSKGRYGPTCDERCTGSCKDNETCDNYNGTCWDGCKDGFYGPFCNQTCGSCKDIACVQMTGDCLSGCQAGWEGSLCNISCSPGYFGPNCKQPCGQCIRGNNSCDIMTGVCEGGCTPGYIAPYCNEVCPGGYHGDNCTFTCGNCSVGTCEPETGICSSGCQTGFQLPFCNQTCDYGSYGPNCNKTCGQCVDRNTCEPGTGVCSAGCLKGQQPPYCNETCTGGYYGDNCSYPCGKCADNKACHPGTGVCDNGCQSSFMTPYCSEKCKSGYYGNNCSHNCGKCTENTSCDPNSGDCPSGCQSGYQGDLCDERCTAGYYGDQCTRMCGQCTEASTCHHVTGKCLSGCQSGYQGDLCDALRAAGGGGVNAAAVGGAIATVVLVLVVIFIVFVVIRHKRRSRKKHKTADVPRREPIIHQNDHTSSSSSDVAGSQTYSIEDTNRKVNKPSALVNPVTRKPLGQDQHPTHSAADIYMNVKLKPVAADDVVDEPVEYKEADDNVYTNDNVYATFRASGPPMDSVQRALVDLLASDQLSSQFKELPKGLRDTHEVAKLKANIKKNRYTSVVPYDYNRVILNDGYKEGTATDYVNASYITGFEEEKKYIASQGPRDHTIEDFWRMVWQENVTQIVMLTNTVEGGQNKCAEYWPAPDTTGTYGPVTVTAVDVQRRASFIVRTFVLKAHDAKRQVEQYHYLAWPDHGVPTTTSLLNFWRFTRSRAPHSPPPPVIVHCTAGVGRTGTYIGLDIAFEEAVARGKVNVLDVVLKMRKERCIMVQTLAQYVFLHKVLLEAYTGRSTSFDIRAFEATFPGSVDVHKENPVVDAEFQRVMQMRSLTPKLMYKDARETENMDKNRSSNAFPSDEHRVYLTARVPGRNQYINAVFMSAYLCNQGNILTQLPLPNTLVDFWRLVDGNDVTTIVSLGSERETESKDFCQYWPVSEKLSIHCEPYVVGVQSISNLGSRTTLYELSMEKKGSEEKRSVILVRFEDWSEEIPGNISEMLSLISFVDNRREMDDNSSPVIFQCMDGVAKSGLFCALCDVISRLTRDKEVDVYMTVRELHTVRPQALTSVVQYRYLYQVAQHWLCDMNVYTNTS